MPSCAKRSSGWSHPRFGFPTPRGVCPVVETVVVAGGLVVLPFLRIGILTHQPNPEIQEWSFIADMCEFNIHAAGKI